MNQFIIWKDLRLFYGSHPRTVKQHSHPIIQWIIAVEDTFRSRDTAGNWVNKQGLLVAPNYPHECDASNTPIISIEVDPESSLGEWILDNQLKGQPILDFPFVNMKILEFSDFLNYLKNRDWPAIRNLIESTFGFKENTRVSPKDGRIQNVLDFISNHIHDTITTDSLMEEAHLSESRLVHLFKEEMGLPIRNYILWYRLQIVIEFILNGDSLTTASYQAGFADQAHMTRTFTKMIGIPPSLVAKNSKFVQVSFP